MTGSSSILNFEVLGAGSLAGGFSRLPVIAELSRELDQKNRQRLAEYERDIESFWNRVEREFGNTADFEKVKRELKDIIIKGLTLVGSPNDGTDLLRTALKCPPEVVLSREAVGDVSPKVKSLKSLIIQKSNEIRKKLDVELVQRGEIAWRVLTSFATMVGGYSSCKVPVLYGPPGVGKTYMPEVIARVLKEYGFNVEVLCVNAAVEHGQNDDLEMKLLGIDARWSNRSVGELVNMLTTCDFVIAVLDEVEKRRDQTLLLSLFDTNIPLKDKSLSAVAPSMNLRPRVMLMGTANENVWKDHSPVSSRVASVPFPPYTTEEKLQIARVLMGKISKEMREHGDNLSRLKEKMILGTVGYLIRRSLIRDIREIYSTLGWLAHSLVYSSVSDDEDAVKEEIRKALEFIGVFGRISGTSRKAGFV